MKRMIFLGPFMLALLGLLIPPEPSWAGARVFVPFPGGGVVVNPDGSGSVRFPGGGVTWPRGEPQGSSRQGLQKGSRQGIADELKRLESVQERLEVEIDTVDDLVAQEPESHEKRDLLQKRRDLETELNRVRMRISRLRSQLR